MVCVASWPLPAMSTRSPGIASTTALVIASSRSTIAQPRRRLHRRHRLARVPGRALRLHQPALDVLDDRRRIFRSRVVGREDHQVTEARRHRAHQRTLRPVAVATASEHRHDALRREGARRLQQVLQRVVGVGVVDDDADVVLGARHELEAPGHGRHVGEAVGNGRQRHLRDRRRRRRRQARCRRWAVRAAACAGASALPACAAPRRCRRASG